MKIIGINYMTVMVRNKNKAEMFYFEKLGLEKVEVGRSVWAKAGRQFVHISKGGNNNKNTFAHFAIEVEVLQEYLEQIILKGVEVFELDDDNGPININEDLQKPRGNILFTIQAEI